MSFRLVSFIKGIHLGGELEREIHFIRDELGSTREFHRDAEAKEDYISEIQEWIRRVRDVAYDTQEVLDGFVMKFARHDRAHGFFGRLHNRLQNIYYLIKNLRARREISYK